MASNVAAEKAAAPGIPFTAEFPKVQDLAGSGAFAVTPRCTTEVQACVRDYLIHSPGGMAYPIYVEVFSNGQLGQFYDVQGTTWANAPLFANPNQTLNVGRRTYDLYYDGSQLQMVAWHEYGAWYWVHNTLTDGVDNGELLAIAEQTVPVLGGPKGGVRSPSKHVILKAFAVPGRPVPTTKTSMRQTLGWIAGLAALVLVPLLTVMVLKQRRRKREIRRRLETNLALVARLSAGISPPVMGPRTQTGGHPLGPDGAECAASPVPGQR